MLRETDDLQVLSLQDFASSVPARLLAANLDVRVLRTNALLMDGDWIQLERAIVEESAKILVGIADLQAMGQTINTGGLGTMLTLYQQQGVMSAASVNMSPDVDSEEDRIEYSLIGLPVPIIAKRFRLNIREITASRQHGGSIDTDHAKEAAKVVAEAQEAMLFRGSPLVIQGYPIYGYLNHPSRNTVSGGDWGTTANIYANVLSGVGALNADGFKGPYKLYLHSDQFIQTLALSANTDRSFRSMLEQIPGFGPGSIQQADEMTAGQAALVSMSSRVVDLAIGQSTIPIEWESKGGMVTHFMVFSCLVPRVKSTVSGKSGVAHLSGI